MSRYNLKPQECIFIDDDDTGESYKTANENVNSKVIVMTMLKQLSVVITIILGKILFREKDIIKKLLYSVLIIVGIGIIFIFK